MFGGPLISNQHSIVPLSIHGGSQGSLLRPTMGQPVPNDPPIKSSSFGPFHNHQRFPVVSDSPSTSAIPSTDLLAYPAAICWFVIAIIVLSVYFPAWKRSWSHVKHKLAKVLFPLFANLDTSAAVVIPLAMLRIETPAPHVAPRYVLGGVDAGQAVFREIGKLSHDCVLLIRTRLWLGREATPSRPAKIIAAGNPFVKANTDDTK